MVDFGIDPRVIGALCTLEELAAFQLEDLLERLTFDVVPDELLLDAAAANLKSFAAVDVTERFPLAMQRISAVFNCGNHVPAFERSTTRH